MAVVVGGVVAEGILVVGHGGEAEVEVEHDGEVLVFIAYAQEEGGIETVEGVEYGAGDLVVPVGLGIAMGEDDLVHIAEEAIAEGRAEGKETDMAGLTDGELDTEIGKDGDLGVPGGIAALADRDDGLEDFLVAGATMDDVDTGLDGEHLGQEGLGAREAEIDEGAKVGGKDGTVGGEVVGMVGQAGSSTETEVEELRTSGEGGSHEKGQSEEYLFHRMICYCYTINSCKGTIFFSINEYFFARINV